MPSLEPRPLAMPRRPPRRRRGRRTAMTPRPAPALEERRPQTRQTLLQIIMAATWPGHVRRPRCSGCRPGRPWRPCASRPAGRRRRPLHLTDAMALKVAREAPGSVWERLGAPGSAWERSCCVWGPLQCKGPPFAFWALCNAKGRLLPVRPFAMQRAVLGPLQCKGPFFKDLGPLQCKGPF